MLHSPKFKPAFRHCGKLMQSKIPIKEEPRVLSQFCTSVFVLLCANAQAVGLKMCYVFPELANMRQKLTVVWRVGRRWRWPTWRSRYFFGWVVNTGAMVDSLSDFKSKLCSNFLCFGRTIGCHGCSFDWSPTITLRLRNLKNSTSQQSIHVKTTRNPLVTQTVIRPFWLDSQAFLGVWIRRP